MECTPMWKRSTFFGTKFDLDTEMSICCIWYALRDLPLKYKLIKYFGITVNVAMFNYEIRTLLKKMYTLSIYGLLFQCGVVLPISYFHQYHMLKRADSKTKRSTYIPDIMMLWPDYIDMRIHSGMDENKFITPVMYLMGYITLLGLGPLLL